VPGKIFATQVNFLYMNGIIEPGKVGRTEYYVRFANPFVQKQLFNYFSNEIFHYMGRLVEPFDTLEDTITAEHLNPVNLIRRYQTYLVKNKDWLLFLERKRNEPTKPAVSKHEKKVEFPGLPGLILLENLVS
jgi:hypothetical protein